MTARILINGDLVETGLKQAVINPSTGGPITEVCVAQAREIEMALASARQAFDKGPWPGLSLKERKTCLLKIAQGILEKAGELADLETLNTGKPIKESTFMDIPSSAETFKHFAGHLEEYLEEETLNIQSQVSTAKSRLVREPRGVVVLIVPWNYPLLIASWKMAQALAAGNTVILKPSSLTPLTALELGKIILDAGIPAGVVNILNGSGEVLGEKLCTDSRVDMVSFTGSNEVGKKIISYCAASAKKLVMELGGKSAGIVLEDADLESAVNGSLCSIFLNQGQMCTAMSRIFVQEGIFDKFVADFTDKAKRLKLGEGSDFQTQMGPLISEAQRKRVLSYVEKAKKDGAKLLCGGKVPDEAGLKKGFFFEPAVFTEIKPQAVIFREEIFGPVAIINKFFGFEEAVELANSTEFGLAACIWTKDPVKAKDLAGRLNAGTVWVNTYGMFFNELPYGGFKQSGFGKELGREGFLEYTRLKNVLEDASGEARPIVNYWYGF
ncbi:MAG: aldehyde dehydrogenase [Candidatus Omnitrophica bacterium]|nr:aldehyde dehydrogenase [Candidatus Omnitrophota bacterium]